MPESRGDIGDTAKTQVDRQVSQPRGEARARFEDAGGPGRAPTRDLFGLQRVPPP